MVSEIDKLECKTTCPCGATAEWKGWQRVVLEAQERWNKIHGSHESHKTQPDPPLIVRASKEP